MDTGAISCESGEDKFYLVPLNRNAFADLCLSLSLSGGHGLFNHPIWLAFGPLVCFASTLYSSVETPLLLKHPLSPSSAPPIVWVYPNTCNSG